jgi:putative hemolysin
MIDRMSFEALAVAVPLILFAEAIFAGSEISILSADKIKLRSLAKDGSSSARRALELAQHPERVLATTLVVTSMCMVAVSTLVSMYFAPRYPGQSELLSVLVASPLVVIFGELLPKSIFQRKADQMAAWAAYPILVGYWLFYPITRLAAFYTSRLTNLLGPIAEWLGGRARNRREELRALLSYGKKESEIKASEKRMIKRIFDFKDTEAKHALIPLVKVEAIEDSARIQEALERFQKHRHSRMPVYSGRIDNIIGTLEVVDLFGAPDLQRPIKEYIAPAHYVPETQSLEDLLQDMHREDTELVVVVDEYGGAVGILTFEDIVEEIVGEIEDEYDVSAVPFKALSQDSWLVQARTEIATLNEQLKLAIPEGDYETLSGFLLQQFGRIPLPGDELFFDTSAGSLKFTIKRASDRRIDSVMVEHLQS